MIRFIFVSIFLFACGPKANLDNKQVNPQSEQISNHNQNQQAVLEQPIAIQNQPMDYDVQKAINQAESIATNPPVVPKSANENERLKIYLYKFKDYNIFAPNKGDNLPVIIWANGCGQDSSVYFNLLNELASKGYVVVQSNKETATKKCRDM